MGFSWVSLNLIRQQASFYSFLHITSLVAVISGNVHFIVFACAGNGIPDFQNKTFCLLQVCAANFGEFCSIVGQEATEKLLVRNDPHYLNLQIMKQNSLISAYKIYLMSLLWTVCNCFVFIFLRCPSSLICARTACGASGKPVPSASWWSPIPPLQRCDVQNCPLCLSASSVTSLVG